MNISYRLSVLDDIALYSLLDPAIIPTGVPGHPAVTQSKYGLFFYIVLTTHWKLPVPDPLSIISTCTTTRPLV